MPGNRSPSSRPDDDWPLVGREDELAALLHALREHRPGAVIAGPRGAGRSRLLREALAGAAAEGLHVEAVQATRSAAAVPLGALLGLVPDDAVPDDPVPGGLAPDDRVFGELARDRPLALMRACARALAERSQGAPTVLGVDDADLLDPASAALLLALVREGQTAVVATVRTGRPCPDAIVSLYKDAGAVCVELDRLGDEQCRALVEAIAGGPVDRAAVRRAVEATGGDAVYLRELTRGAIASGALTQRGGLWTVVRHPEPSAALREIAAAELSELDADQRELVELVALGEQLTDAEIEALGAVDAASAAQASGMLVGDGDAVALARPLLGEVVRAGLPRRRAVALRRRLLAATGGSGDALTDDAALRLARLRMDAGETPDVELLLRASRAAIVTGDLSRAGELARAALDQERSLSAALALAQARRLSGGVAEAERLLASVEDLAPGHCEARAYAAEWLGVLFWDMRRTDEVTALLERMGHWSDADGWRAFVDRLRVTFGGVAEGRGDIAVAERIAADERLPERPRRMSGAAYRLGLLLAGHGEQAATAALHELPEVRGGDDVELADLATLVFVALESGSHWDVLERHLEHVIERASQARVRTAVGIAALGMARLRVARGRLHDASRWLMEAEVHLSRRDPFHTMVGVRSVTVGVAALAGDYEGARLAHAALQSAIAVREPLANQRPGVLSATARLEAMRNPAQAARRLLADAETVAEEMPGLAPALAYEALRLRDAAAPEVLTRLTAGCDAPLADAFLAHADARTAHSGAALLDAADAMAQIGAALHASEIAAEAAAVFLDEGRQDSARRAAARAREWHAADQGAPAPEIDGLHGAAVELTAREAQLLELAREGLSNAEIADRLVISVRTAETHLYRGMRKLGVRDRRDL